MAPSVLVIADDYALSAGVTAAILDLGRRRRLSGTGAMVPSPRWRHDAAGLRDMPDGFQTGLHLTLTGSLMPLGPMPVLCPDGRFPALGRWLLLSHAGRLHAPAMQAELAAEIDRQLDGFEAAMGRPPHFVDGHQHVHLLPGIRPLVLAAVARRYPAGGVWVRDCHEGAGRIVARGVAAGKALFIAALARGMAEDARTAGLTVNRGFSGIHGFRGDFPRLLPRFLARMGDGGLLMVHPALPDDELATLDPVVGARQVEMACLTGPQWPAALQRAGLDLRFGPP
ncbi:ChbG/HpnK family deacetylase [Niveispirillum fermenti]|uniref:ChbG/HpnK family deacetylase n=1 Tax=Niveispirillum fermenti TaxID=1233113 RepID=UPI003A8902D1